MLWNGWVEIEDKKNVLKLWWSWCPYFGTQQNAVVLLENINSNPNPNSTAKVDMIELSFFFFNKIKSKNILLKK